MYVEGVNTVKKGYVCSKWCLQLLHDTVYRIMVLMSELLKVYSTLYTGSLALPGRKVHHQSCGFSSSPV